LNRSGPNRVHPSTATRHVSSALSTARTRRARITWPRCCSRAIASATGSSARLRWWCAGRSPRLHRRANPCHDEHRSSNSRSLANGAPNTQFRPAFCRPDRRSALYRVKTRLWLLTGSWARFVVGHDRRSCVFGCCI
jgi:hypothetical protein